MFGSKINNKVAVTVDGGYSPQNSNSKRANLLKSPLPAQLIMAAHSKLSSTANCVTCHSINLSLSSSNQLKKVITNGLVE